MPDKRRVIIRPGEKSVEANKKFLFGKEYLRKEGLSPAVQDYRQRAWAAYERSGFPDQNSESWRRTNLRDFQPTLYQTISVPVGKDSKSILPEKELDGILGKLEVSENGSVINISDGFMESGIEFNTLPEAEQQKSHALDEIQGKTIDPARNIFTALAGSFAQYGALVNVPSDLTLDRPLVIQMKVEGQGKAFFSHNLIRIGPGSQAIVILETLGEPGIGGDCFHSGLVEILLDEGAKLTFVELQSLNMKSWNFGYTKVRLGKGANLDWVIGTTGGKFSKIFSEMELSGEGSAGKASGFYFSDHIQLIDHETLQDHLAPNTTSDLLFKGALKDESRSVWRGMIHVAPDAKKTDGYQANRNLILSDAARADSIPGLEILTDDVRCTHGATVGKIDPDQVFYLESRGIPKTEAEKLVVEGFFESVIARIPLVEIRERFKQFILHKMNG